MRLLSYPIGWFAVCCALFFMAPSTVTLDAGVEMRQPVMLTFAGLWSHHDVSAVARVEKKEVAPVAARAQESIAPVAPASQTPAVSVGSLSVLPSWMRREVPAAPVENPKKIVRRAAPKSLRIPMMPHESAPTAASSAHAEATDAAPTESMGSVMGPSMENVPSSQISETTASEKTRMVAQFSAEDGSRTSVPPRQPAVANPLPYSEEISRIAREHGVSPALAAAVIKVESGFKASARSYRGARGLMQLLPATARQVGVHEDLGKPEHNIRAGVKYLKEMLDRYDGDEKMALAAYNAGPAAVDRYNNIPPYRETKRYVPKVLQYVEEYVKYFQEI